MGEHRGKSSLDFQLSESVSLIRAMSAGCFHLASCDKPETTNSGATFLRPRVSIRDDQDCASLEALKVNHTASS